MFRSMDYFFNTIRDFEFANNSPSFKDTKKGRGEGRSNRKREEKWLKPSRRRRGSPSVSSSSVQKQRGEKGGSHRFKQITHERRKRQGKRGLECRYRKIRQWNDICDTLRRKRGGISRSEFEKKKKKRKKKRDEL